MARAFVEALEHPRAAGKVYNFGSGHERTVSEVAELLAVAMRRAGLAPEILGKGRTGDVRHCFPDMSLARELMDYEPETLLDDGLAELAEWLEAQTAVDNVDTMRAELASRGLTI